MKKLFSKGNTIKCLATLLVVGAMMIACGGPSQYSQIHQDSYIIQVMDRLNMSPESTAKRITGLVKAEIAMGTFTKQQALVFIAARRSDLAVGASYTDAWSMVQMFMSRYVKSDPSNPVSQAVTIAFYLFADEISAIPNPNMNIAGTDLQVCNDLLNEIQKGVEAMPENGIYFIPYTESMLQTGDNSVS